MSFQRRLLITVIVFVLTITGFTNVFAIDNAPANMAAALSFKILALENNISGAGDITIYVLGSTEMTGEYTKGVGQSIGGSKLTSVTGGTDLPATKPNIIFVGDEASLAKALEYSHANKVLTVTNLVDLVSKGVTLGIGVEGGTPKILLNLSSSVSEGLDWQPAIMSIAQKI
jgi:YfiR/HmsC-like